MATSHSLSTQEPRNNTATNGNEPKSRRQRKQDITTTTTTTTCNAPQKSPEAENAVKTENQVLFLKSNNFWEECQHSWSVNGLPSAVQDLIGVIRHTKKLSSDAGFRQNLYTFLNEKLIDCIFCGILVQPESSRPNALKILTESFEKLENLFEQETGRSYY